MIATRGFSIFFMNIRGRQMGPNPLAAKAFPVGSVGYNALCDAFDGLALNVKPPLPPVRLDEIAEAIKNGTAKLSLLTLISGQPSLHVKLSGEDRGRVVLATAEQVREKFLDAEIKHLDFSKVPAAAKEAGLEVPLFDAGAWVMDQYRDAVNRGFNLTRPRNSPRL